MTKERPDQFASLLEFLGKLEDLRAEYRLARIRKESVMVEVYAPGEHWEVEFMDDGSLEIERYRTTVGIEGREVLGDLWELFRPPAEPRKMKTRQTSTTRMRKPRQRG